MSLSEKIEEILDKISKIVTNESMKILSKLSLTF